VTTTFARRDDSFVVRTEGDDGEPHDFDVAYVFGVYPLQQYLVAFPRGRYQVLPVAWDSRPKAQGGQRWFHIYGDERIAPGDELFWTGRAQNWNYMCADCHSTNLARNYDLESDSYATTWSEIDVACEACHGPGSEHAIWAAERDPDADPYDDDSNDPKGLVVKLGRPKEREWVIDPETGTATVVSRDDAELRACAPCHSRRSYLRTDIVHGRPLLDSYRLAGLDESLYFADGQMRDEVYVYGSFLQSRMHTAGVSCGDCHEAHSLRMRAEGNALCVRCHLDTKYDGVEHHHHEPGTPGAECVECHMPVRKYMVVDPRLDHSIRIPRPDLTELVGSPNACNGCHTDESAAWADEHITTWMGGNAERPRHYGTDLHLGRTRGPGADAHLLALATDPDRPSMARAAALALLAQAPGPNGVRAVASASRDPDPIVRAAAVRALIQQPPPLRESAVPLLRDPVLGVRVVAARVLAAYPKERFDAATQTRFDTVFAEFVVSEMAAAERPSAHLNLGVAYTDLGRLGDAEQSYRTALRLEPGFAEAAVNLSDVLRLRGQDEEAETFLRGFIEDHPRMAALHHALGLVLVRLGRSDEAVPELAQAATLQPENARFTYVYAVALQSGGDVVRAIDVLEDGLRRNPNDAEMLVSLAAMCREAGDIGRAIVHAERLTELLPRSEGARSLLETLLDERSER